MNYKSEIEEIFNLATLHSWCTQVNQLIEDFNTNNSESDLIRNYLRTKLKEKKLPREHYIISLVLLNYQKYPIDDIIELSIDSLYSKLNKNDIIFFKKHLFNGKFPLSADLSEDITNRSFLSPKMAIKKAMKIDSVISKSDPMKTVLFMNFILSRMDMNEENRAMVAFLLLRLDINLPKNLEKKVFKYLLVYKDILKELLEEEAGETVDIDDIYGIQNKIKKIEIVEETEKSRVESDPKIEKKAIPKDGLISNIEPFIKTQKASSLKVKELNIENTKKNIKLSKKTISDKTKTTIHKISDKMVIQASSLKENNKLISKKILKTTNEGKKEISINANHESLTLPVESLKNTIDKSRSNETKSQETIKDKTKHSEIIPFSTIEKKEEEKRWDINLKQSKSILENILSGINKTKEKVIGSDEKDIFPKLARKKKLYGIILLFLAFIFVFFVIKNVKEKKPGILASNINLEEKIIEPKNKKITINTDAVSTSEENFDIQNLEIPENFPFDITIVHETIEWKVVSGDSISDFFFALQEFRGKLENTKLEKISKLNWDQFFDIFKSNNPIRDSYHIIFPGEKFILPLD